MAFKCDRDLFFGKSKREYCRRTRSVKPVVAPQERGPGKACFLCQPCRKELGVKDKPKVKVIIRKSYPSDKAFKKAIRAFLDKHPGADELDIANGVRSGLRETCKAIDELVAAGLIERMNGSRKRTNRGDGVGNKKKNEAARLKGKNIMKKLGSGNIWFGKLDGQPTGYYRVSLSDKEGNPKRLNISNLGAWVRVRLWAEVLER